ncbi:hypothetical protein MNBD_GAMMA04-712 [hydrothermal vent metagenome]|uniref:Uncharacterized protein n=1 Tax=hydrothermal vent metagenome TaxID=652676 RepID=A0A3B0WCE4_9ZZZZ
MWIEYIAEIGMGLFIFLIAIHFVPFFWSKAKCIKRQKQKQPKQTTEN